MQRFVVLLLKPTDKQTAALMQMHRVLLLFMENFKEEAYLFKAECFDRKINPVH